MIAATQEITRQNIQGTTRVPTSYQPMKIQNDEWTMILGDACEEIKTIPDNSVHYIIFSPPFSSLYTYSDSERDLGNSRSDVEFLAHFQYLAKDLFRILLPGRLMSVHCMDLPRMKEREGIIGVKDFPGMLIRMFEAKGFVFHSRVTIWKDPVTEMQRTKALGLLWKQLKKDSSMCRQGLPDYLLTFRKLGNNPEPIKHTSAEFPVDLWQRYASPVWMDINQSETLQRYSAREYKDEKHIAPLQLEVIRRSLELWTNPNDLVFSPFAGIGSEGYEAIRNGRKFIGIELKRSYFNQAVANLKKATYKAKEPPQSHIDTFQQAVLMDRTSTEKGAVKNGEE